MAGAVEGCVPGQTVSWEGGLAMAKGQRRDVVRSKDGSGWDVTKPGSKQPVSHHQTQANAARAAMGDLKRGSGGEVAVHGRDGRIRNKDTVPPARDPYPPKG